MVLLLDSIWLRPRSSEAVPQEGQHSLSRSIFSLTEAKIIDMYRPVLKEEGGEWKRLGVPVDF